MFSCKTDRVEFLSRVLMRYPEANPVTAIRGAISSSVFFRGVPAQACTDRSNGAQPKLYSRMTRTGKTWVSSKLASLGLVCFAGTAFGAIVTITNPDFETDALADGGVVVGEPTGWDISGSIAGYFDPDAATYGYPAGENNAAFFFNPAGPLAMSQDTSYTVISGDVFTLTIDFGNRGGVAVADPLNAFASFGLYDAGTGLAIATRTVTNGDLGADGTFQSVTLNYATTAGDVGKQIRIQINAGVDGAPNDYLDFDNVVLEVVPEPSSAILGGIGLGSLLLRRRRVAHR